MTKNELIELLTRIPGNPEVGVSVTNGTDAAYSRKIEIENTPNLLWITGMVHEDDEDARAPWTDAPTPVDQLPIEDTGPTIADLLAEDDED